MSRLISDKYRQVQQEYLVDVIMTCIQKELERQR